MEFDMFGKVFLMATLLLPLAVYSSDKGKKQFIIQQSINSYMATGKNCACPYHYAKNGTLCGKRSAYSRRAAVLCYPTDVTDAMLINYPHRTR